jgi:hypothetical protein
MVGKRLLPLLGGAPAVWNTCMVFFQSALLVGYALAHALSKLKSRRQLALYLALLAAGLLAFRGAFSPAVPPGLEASPVLWLLGTLARDVFLPFCALAAAGPLLQKWYARADPRVSDPFFLYSASNLGSLGALLAYPVLIEPFFPLRTQAAAWSIGYFGFVLIAGACGWLASRRQSGDRHPIQRNSAPANRTAVTKVWWLVFAFVPSSLMLGATTHITTNIAPMPLLWVLPLAAYLLTFILAFARRPPIPLSFIARAVPLILVPLALLSFMEFKGMRWLLVPAHLLVLFAAGMLSHTRLAQSRPEESELTSFYLWVAAGGALGGVFNALIAPLLFRSVSEYPLALVAAAALLPAVDKRKDLVTRLLDMALPLAVGIAGAWTVLFLRTFHLPQGSPAAAAAFGLLAVFCLSFRPRPLRFAFGFAMLVWTYGAYAHLRTGRVLVVERDFFGVKRVLYDSVNDLNQFVHGATFHGMQSRDPAKRKEPVAYYGRSGPAGEFFGALGGRGGRFAVVGLGIGTLAAYSSPDRSIDFYELDPAVERLARDRRYFTYLSDCSSCSVKLGDGRLRLAEAPARSYDAIVLDVFGSEAVPAHFLTREAFKEYDEKLADGGLLLFNISQRYLDFEPLLAALAAERGWTADVRFEDVPADVEEATGRLTSRWVAVARTRADSAPLEKRGWSRLSPRPGFRPWTDEFTDLLPLVRWL